MSNNMKFDLTTIQHWPVDEVAQAATARLKEAISNIETEVQADTLTFEKLFNIFEIAQAEINTAFAVKKNSFVQCLLESAAGFDKPTFINKTELTEVVSGMVKETIEKIEKQKKTAAAIHERGVY
jgi:hypothetical protein